MKELISQGAEAKIFKEEDKVRKERISKSYRFPELDEKIRKSRTKREAKILLKAREVANVPEVFNIGKKGIPRDKFVIEIEFINGDRLSETLNSYELELQKNIMEQIGEQLAKLHSEDIIHGDLTTSNTILKEDIVYIIDFGLGFISHRLEDKAVDLHLIKQALQAKHFQNDKELYESFLEGYTWGRSDEVLKQLEKVESRGRYRH